jgi:hypothetical protein
MPPTGSTVPVRKFGAMRLIRSTKSALLALLPYPLSDNASNVPSLPRSTPLKPWIGWSAKGGVIPLTGAVPSSEPDGSLALRKVSAGSAAKPVRTAGPNGRPARSGSAADAAAGVMSTTNARVPAPRRYPRERATEAVMAVA